MLAVAWAIDSDDSSGGFRREALAGRLLQELAYDKNLQAEIGWGEQAARTMRDMAPSSHGPQ